MDMTFTTNDNTGAYYGLTYNNSMLEGVVMQNDFERLTFKGSDGGSSSYYWGIALRINGPSFVNYLGLLIYGSSGALGAGVDISGNGAINPYFSIVHNFSMCGFFKLGIGIVYGDYIQGVSISQCNFTNGITGVYIPPSITGAAQLAITGSQFNTTANQISINSPIASIILSNNLIYVPNNNTGLYINSTGAQHSIVNNIFTGPLATPVGSTGIYVGASNEGAVVIGNVFFQLATGVNLTGTSSWNVQGNSYTRVTTRVSNIGTNSVGVVTY
jgi:hypothetical protein